MALKKDSFYDMSVFGKKFFLRYGHINEILAPGWFHIVAKSNFPSLNHSDLKKVYFKMKNWKSFIWNFTVISFRMTPNAGQA